jgi:hypothetical protein
MDVRLSVLGRTSISLKQRLRIQNHNRPEVAKCSNLHKPTISWRPRASVRRLIVARNLPIREVMAVPDSDTIALWWHYEELAMHFNGLIMQFRLQVLGGVGAIGAVAGYLINRGEITDAKQLERLRAVIAGGLCLLVFCLALLDVLYYRVLLDGAVKAIIDFEGQHPKIQMSSEIQRMVGWRVHVIWAFYGLPLLALGAFALTSWRKSR